MGGKKKNESSVDDVIRMRQQGMPDQMIIQQLQSQRLQMPQIQDLLYHADVKMSVASPQMGPPRPSSGTALPMPPAMMGPHGFEQGAPSMGSQMSGGSERHQIGESATPMGMPQGPPQQLRQQFQQQQQQPQTLMPQRPPQAGAGAFQQMQAPMPAGPLEDFSKMRPVVVGGAMSSIRTEELVEKIVSEKWKSVEEHVERLENTKVELTNQIQDLRDEMNDLKSKYVQLQEDSSVRIEEYGKDLEGVGAQIKAMQRILQNMIPDIAKNVKDLNDVVMRIKTTGGESQLSDVEFPKKIGASGNKRRLEEEETGEEFESRL